jgi:hypothetical protein
MMMDEISDANSNVKITFYYEDEMKDRPSVQVIKSDLDYIKKWYAWHPAFAHKEDKPVLFIWNAGGCEIAERWMEAANNEWYIVLKIFPGFDDCAVQPDHWVSCLAKKRLADCILAMIIRPLTSDPTFLDFHCVSTNMEWAQEIPSITEDIRRPLLLDFGEQISPPRSFLV